MPEPIQTTAHAAEALRGFAAHERDSLMSVCTLSAFVQRCLAPAPATLH